MITDLKKRVASGERVTLKNSIHSVELYKGHNDRYCLMLNTKVIKSVKTWLPIQKKLNEFQDLKEVESYFGVPRDVSLREVAVEVLPITFKYYAEVDESSHHYVAWSPKPSKLGNWGTMVSLLTNSNILDDFGMDYSGGISCQIRRVPQSVFEGYKEIGKEQFETALALAIQRIKSQLLQASKIN